MSCVTKQIWDFDVLALLSNHASTCERLSIHDFREQQLMGFICNLLSVVANVCKEVVPICAFPALLCSVCSEIKHKKINVRHSLNMVLTFKFDLHVLVWVKQTVLLLYKGDALIYNKSICSH